MIKNLLPTLDHEKYLRFAIELAYNSREEGNHPFGAILVGSNGEIILKAMNTFGIKGDSTSHAERNLMSLASIKYDPEFLKNCTMYASAEPCAMCSGAVYWAGIGRVVYGMTEKDLKKMIGPNPENLTMDLPCRKVFSSGQRHIEVVGPLLEDESSRVHIGFW